MISAVVMAHPRRRPFVEQLLEHVGPIEVVWDRKEDRWDTGRRALAAYDPAATHHLVVQDDAIPCSDFLAGCEAAAEGAGEHPIALYIGCVRPHVKTISPAVKWLAHYGKPWLAGQGPWWGVGIIIPTAHIDELVKWGDPRRHIVNYDKRISKWYDQQKLPCLYSVPSLVDHRPVKENPSLIRGRTGNRRAQLFIGARSPLEIDWTQEPVALKTRWANQQTGRQLTAFLGGPNYKRLMRSPAWQQV